VKVTSYIYNMRLRALLFLSLLTASLAFAADRPYAHIDCILVEKAARTMKVFYKDKLLKTYKVALGGDPIGPKTQFGDEKTPEGKYTISWKNPHSQYHLSLHISYPSLQDVKNAKAKGVDAGGEIFIHGLPNGKAWIGASHSLHDWTLGCVAVTSEEIEEIYHATPNGTPIEIKP
jgi:murein L,D-transpeptidase YafK